MKKKKYYFYTLLNSNKEIHYEREFDYLKNVEIAVKRKLGFVPTIKFKD